MREHTCRYIASSCRAMENPHTHRTPGEHRRLAWSVIRCTCELVTKVSIMPLSLSGSARR